MDVKLIFERDECKEEQRNNDKKIGEQIMEPLRKQYITVLTT